MKEGTLMPSDKPESVKKWRHPISTVQTLDSDAFVEKVLENGLRVLGPHEGYYYLADETDDGYDLIRTPARTRWFYNVRRVATQANAGGGAIIIDITCPTGQLYKLVSCRGANSGTNTLIAVIADEDLATDMTLAEIASAAGTKFSLPSIGSTSGTSANIANSTGLLFGQAHTLSIYQTGAGIANDTLTISMTLEVLNPKGTTTPIYSKDRSTNAADVTLAASTISATNTLIELVDTSCPW